MNTGGSDPLEPMFKHGMFKHGIEELGKKRNISLDDIVEYLIKALQEGLVYETRIKIVEPFEELFKSEVQIVVLEEGFGGIGDTYWYSFIYKADKDRNNISFGLFDKERPVGWWPGMEQVINTYLMGIKNNRNSLQYPFRYGV